MCSKGTVQRSTMRTSGRERNNTLYFKYLRPYFQNHATKPYDGNRKILVDGDGGIRVLVASGDFGVQILPGIYQRRS